LIEDGASKEDFQVELLGVFPLEECLEREKELAMTSLFPKGLNGNAGSAMIRTKDGQEKVTQCIKKSIRKRIQTGTHSFVDSNFQKRMSERSLIKQRENGNIERFNQKGQQATHQLVKEGKHPFQDRDKQKERAIKRTKDGKNPFQGEGGSKLATENNQQMLLEGRHPSQIKVSCVICQKVCSIANFSRYHNGKCGGNK
jgi:hypothetical protein